MCFYFIKRRKFTTIGSTLESFAPHNPLSQHKLRNIKNKMKRDFCEWSKPWSHKKLNKKNLLLHGNCVCVILDSLILWWWWKKKSFASTYLHITKEILQHRSCIELCRAECALLIKSLFLFFLIFFIMKSSVIKIN